jgi:hypothetical protein
MFIGKKKRAAMGPQNYIYFRIINLKRSNDGDLSLFF